jgi:hypothetical protein
MAKTIGQLTALGAVPDDTDELVIADSGVTKKITAANLKGDCLRTISDVIAVPDADDISFGTTTGTKLGTAATQKIGFWNAAPVVQPSAVADATDATDVVAQLNDLLAKLRTVGIIAT